jgi:hypothetical protein
MNKPRKKELLLNRTISIPLAAFPPWMSTARLRVQLPTSHGKREGQQTYEIMNQEKERNSNRKMNRTTT